MPDRLAWTRSTRCDSGSCVEATHRHGQVLVRDSKLGDQSPLLDYTRGQWLLVLAAIRITGRTVDVRRTLRPWRGWVWRWKGKKLRFTRAEWKAFVAGVKAGDFDPDRLEAANA